jgi:hypothetical protein
MERLVLTDAQWAKMEPHCLGARSGPWRPGFPVDGDQHFQSMTTTCSG